MNRWQWLLLGVLLAEIAGGAILWGRRRPESPPVPPEIDLTAMDPLAADEIREWQQRVRVEEDRDRLAEVYLAFGRARESAWCVAQVATESQSARNFDLAFSLERLAALDAANARYSLAASKGHPRPEECHYYIARNDLRADRPDKALEALDRAGKLPAARYQRAALLARNGKFAEAVALLGELTREYPGAIQPYLLRYKIEAIRGGTGQALYSDLALHAPGRLPNPFDRQWDRLESRYKGMGLERQWSEARAELAAGHQEAASKRLKAALARQWEPVGADLLAESELLAGRPAEAVRLLEKAIGRAGATAHFETRLGDAHAEANRPEQAAKAWSRAAELGIGAEVKDVHYKLANHHQKAGRRAESRRHMAQAYLAAGHEQYWAGRLTDALTAFTKSAELDPRSAAAWFYLGEVHRRGGRPAESRKAYQSCLEIDPGHGRAHRGLALLGAR